MSTWGYVLIGLGLVVLFVIVIFIRLWMLPQAALTSAFVDLEVRIKKQRHDVILNLVKQRHDLILNLVETVKGCVAHESGVFEKVTEALASAMGATTMQEKCAAMNAALLNLLAAVAENYPELKTNKNVLRLLGKIGDLEEKISRKMVSEGATVYVNPDDKDARC